MDQAQIVTRAKQELQQRSQVLGFLAVKQTAVARAQMGNPRGAQCRFVAVQLSAATGQNHNIAIGCGPRHALLLNVPRSDNALNTARQFSGLVGAALIVVAGLRRAQQIAQRADLIFRLP